MKRILIFLLLLAVAGGLFAQTLVWSGAVNAGLAVQKTDDADDPLFGLIGKNVAGSSNGAYARLHTTYTNEAGTAGFVGRIQASANPTNWSTALQLNRAYGWVTAGDGLFKLVGGRINAGELAGIDSVWADSFAGGTGIHAYVSPLGDLLKIGFGVNAKTGLGASLSGGDAPIWDNSPLILWGGFGVESGFLSVASEIQYQKSATNAHITAAAELGIVDIDTGAYIYNINELSDEGEMIFTATFGFNVLDNLGLYVAGIYGLNNAEEDPYIGALVAVDYDLGVATPSLAVGYSTGGEDAYDSGLDSWRVVYSPTYNKNQVHLTVQPAVEIPLARGALEIGAAINKDMGDVAAAGSSNKGMSFAAFIDYRITF